MRHYTRQTFRVCWGNIWVRSTDGIGHIGSTVSSYFVLCLPFLVCDIMGERIRWLYVTFHAIHHNYSSPCALSLVTIGFWTTLNPIILRCHLLTTWAFMLLHVNVSIEDHSGYDFPWSTSRLIPLGIYGGPSKHGVHHQKPNTNFAPHFSHWDKIFGTHADFSFSSAMK
uniref:Fatty acid hydroxylase domain-containing protein n=1 Tax=Mola mola TaxID=94237 RepID=A0A3Q4AVC6_MOLML